MFANFLLPLAQAAAAAAPAATGPESPTQPLHAGWKLLIAIGVVVVSYLIGRILGSRLRMPEYGWKIGVVSFAVIAAAVVTAMGWDPTNKQQGVPWPTRLGVDLSGGVILVYEVKPPKPDEPPVDMALLCKVIADRIDPGKTKQIVVRPAGQTSRQVEIIIPRVERSEIEDTKRKIVDLGSLEFLIICHLEDHELKPGTKYISAAQRLPPEVNELRGDTGTLIAKWVPLKRGSSTEQKMRAFTDLPLPGELVNADGIPTRQVKLADGTMQHQVLCYIEPDMRVEGGNLTRVRPGTDYKTGMPSVDFSLDSVGARRMGALTKKYLTKSDRRGEGKHLAIILSGYLETAPTIQGVITDNGQITGYNKAKERNDVIAVLQAGQLPGELNPLPISEQSIAATLGFDTIIRGSIALASSLGLVLIFMLVYYRGWLGGAACIALILNMVLTIACMVAIRAALTFPGMAGVVLSLGMAVDANVLIYERIREELAKGSALRMALRNGYDKAMSTIIDSNLTTVLTAVILYIIGTDQIRGFSVTLILGLCLSMFTAVFCSRILFEICERKRLMRRVHMMQIMSKTNFDFLSKARVAITLSIILIAVGMAAVAMRGQGILDIIFTGGTKAQIVFRDDAEGQPPTVAGVRKVVNDWNEKVARADGAALAEILGEDALRTLQKNVPDFPKTSLREVRDEQELNRVRSLLSLPDVTVTSIQESVTGEKRAPSFYLNTSNLEFRAVRAVLDRVFAGKLTTNTLAFQGQVAAPTVDDETAPTEDPTGQTPARQRWIGNLSFAFPVAHDDLRDRLASHLPQAVFLRLSNPRYVPDTRNAFREWQLTVEAPEPAVIAALTSVQQALAQETYFPEVDNFAGAVSADARINAFVALLASMVGIIIYIWIRFQRVAFGIAAVAALVHDVLVTLGMLALSSYLTFIPTIDPFKIDLEIVAAFLTIMGFSLNDTIVIFDRIREIRGKSPIITPAMINRAVNETLSRTILTSLTVFMTVIVLYFFAGQAIHGFAYAMVVGVIAGTYSTVFIACPVLLWILKLKAFAQMQSVTQYGGEMAGGPAAA